MGQSYSQAAITVFESAARTATTTSDEQTVAGGPGGRGQYQGIVLMINCTALVSAPSVVFTIQTSLDDGTGDWWDVLVSAPSTAEATQVLVVHPGVLTTRANLIDVGPLGSKWRVLATHSNSNSITYSVRALPIP